MEKYLQATKSNNGRIYIYIYILSNFEYFMYFLVNGFFFQFLGVDIYVASKYILMSTQNISEVSKKSTEENGSEKKKIGTMA